MVLCPTEQHTKMRKKTVKHEKKNKVATCCLVSSRSACGTASHRAAYKSEEGEDEVGEEE